VRVSFIVPAYNEAGTILEVLERVEGLGLDTQIVVVDDGSTDGTADIVEEWRQGRNGTVLVRKANGGRAAPSAPPSRRSTATSS